MFELTRQRDFFLLRFALAPSRRALPPLAPDLLCFASRQKSCGIVDS
jgi:hypothetical protein